MKQLKAMKETLMAATQSQLANLAQVDTKELGCAIDMIKDLSEAIYYCEIIKSMEKAEERQEEQMKMQQTQMTQYEEPMYYSEPRPSRRMGATNTRRSPQMNRQLYYPRSEMQEPMEEYEYYPQEHDPREGRSPARRKSYMEMRTMAHDDKSSHIRELEAYIQELGSDVLEMIQGASAEEKQILHRKLVALANKVQQATE